MKSIWSRLDEMIGDLWEDEPKVSDKELIDLLEDARNHIVDLEAMVMKAQPPQEAD